jgi:type II secretory pathway pseudopilin PulG
MRGPRTRFADLGDGHGAARSRRPALTLVEVLLVLALLVIASAVSIPLLGASIDRARLVHSGDLLRAAWAKARLSAMQAGDTYAFRFEPKGSRFQISLASAISADGSTTGTSSTSESATSEEYTDSDILRLSRDQLPDGVIFDSAQLASDARQSMPSTSDWSEPILFYPDGATGDAVVLLANARGNSLRVTLRGLTGVSRVGVVGKGGGS